MSRLSVRTEYILVIEDEESLSEKIKLKLEREGYSVQSCTNHSEAVSRLNKQVYSCIVVDQVIQRGTGRDIILKIRENSKELNYKTPVIVVSGNIDNSLIQEVGDKIQGAIVKPFSLESLSQKINEVINKKES